MFGIGNHDKKKSGFEIEDVSRSSGQSMGLATRRLPLSAQGSMVLAIFSMLVFAVFAARVFYLQIINGAHYQEIARENRLRKNIIKAPRGLILDRFGEELVVNIPSYDLVVVMSDLPSSKNERNGMAADLAKIMNMNDESLKTIIETSDFNSTNPVLVKENVTNEEALVFAEKKAEFPGFVLEKSAQREYPDGQIFSPILGYSGKITRNELEKYSEYLMTDLVGKTGLEESYEKNLHGVNGYEKVEVDSAGNVKHHFGTVHPTKGADLETNIDAGLQKKIYESFAKMLEETGTKTASAVAIDPRDGAVRAIVNLPSYDNNKFSGGISSEDYKSLIEDENRPMLNRAIGGEYPPGSTVKPIMALAALEEKTITAETNVNCVGGISIGEYQFPDWKTHGVTDVRKAIAQSCDVFFYAIGGGWGDIKGLGINKMSEYAKNVGLGVKLGIDIQGETDGLMPDRDWKMNRFNERWYTGDDYHSAIGQGFDLSTPLQLASYTATIANGGRLYRPQIARSRKFADGREESVDPEVIKDNKFSQRNIEIVREGMRQTVTSGSAKNLNDMQVAVAGKTGTAQFGSEDKTHGWFISFAPYENPEIALVVLVEGGGEGHSTAVPVTREAYEWYFRK